MKVIIESKNETKTFSNIWEIQSNILNSYREIQLVGYDHIIKYKKNASLISHIDIEFEIDNKE